MLYTFNLYNVICQIYSIKKGKHEFSLLSVSSVRQTNSQVSPTTTFLTLTQELIKKIPSFLVITVYNHSLVQRKKL